MDTETAFCTIPRRTEANTELIVQLQLQTQIDFFVRSLAGWNRHVQIRLMFDATDQLVIFPNSPFYAHDFNVQCIRNSFLDAGFVFLLFSDGGVDQSSHFTGGFGNTEQLQHKALLKHNERFIELMNELAAPMCGTLI